MRVVDLKWSAAARAETYEVYYSLGDNFAEAEKFSEETGTSVRVTGLEDGKAYNFWVVAKNAGGSAMRSMAHPAMKTSDDIPDYLKVNLVPGGEEAYYVATNLGWPSGDYYIIQDRGENYPLDERYYFGYGYFGDDFGTIKYVRKFANPPEEPAVGRRYGSPPGPVYDLDWDINRGVIIYQSGNKLIATYYVDAHIEPRNSPSDHAPQAVMGQANGYSSGVNDPTTKTLVEAINTFAKIGGPGESGGRYAYFTMMYVAYAYQSKGFFNSWHR
jgi:hypothetical protein